MSGQLVTQEELQALFTRLQVIISNPAELSDSAYSAVVPVVNQLTEMVFGLVAMASDLQTRQNAMIGAMRDWDWRSWMLDDELPREVVKFAERVRDDVMEECETSAVESAYEVMVDEMADAFAALFRPPHQDAADRLAAFLIHLDREDYEDGRVVEALHLLSEVAEEFYDEQRGYNNEAYHALLKMDFENEEEEE